ncbi:NADH dehydrogenase, alpha subcomplex, subunit 6 [Wallemia mellicola]|uniref:NADH dehydrogenase, alpha subcomplex, subunit 6 n=2 Tax=Wallemia mellicola TaxID=1708541 RepID=A0A4V4MGV4_9BASI|nr:NADH dehydrogenase, alpha subcomplex, subunit 6 [Wallemia mellicola CBS 633.66]TIB74190.1 hypothetical protein E3Q24_00658 [Wallemia mellicola]EIM23478.1 NADH dehydrogenase, alpha subcomplex, subunit 6 [Wallemia mellicola CBS 633.66]TIB78822.1 hypothetical protein E3Q23_00563 [Wallemia mellicola]TIB81451.1 NADH dehydrogenase, alpha subcomplex, subunit 6 [Wallemia mellicola]TIB90451.1 NADH dehydrogenase, alpha subcomplex, subunit 6 [Wallemia mellicola]|eukprot:XP_006956157.1 NADH dehydrogenase, alpha subcomplex, subunit 6 [Wallemia mellicola CBS 633.66]
MTTIPSRLAHVTKSSTSFAEAHARARTLYRDFYRSAPSICALYSLNIPPSQIRAKIRQEFEKNRNLDDLNVIDLVLFKGRQEYQETMNAWKQETHIMRWFALEEAPPRPQTFLEKFYAGRDEDQV